MQDYIIPNYASDYQASAPKSNLKGFDDLCFQTHPGFQDGKARQARLKFGSRDQFTISVVQNLNDGNGLYGHIDDNTYEVAMWYDGRDTMLPLGLGDDVLGWQTPMKLLALCTKRISTISLGSALLLMQEKNTTKNWVLTI